MIRIAAITLAFLFAIGLANATTVTGGSGGGNSTCSANSTLGQSCSVTCPPGKTAKCEGGLVSATCTCEIDPSGTPSLRDVPNISPADVTNITDLATFCQNYGSSNMSTLAGKITTVLTAIQNNNASSYTYAEVDYANYFINNLTSTEKNAINTWVQNKGYAGF